MKWIAKIDHVDFVGVESVEKSDQLYHLFHGRTVEVDCDEDSIEEVLREAFSEEAQLGVEEVEFSYREGAGGLEAAFCDGCGCPIAECDCD